MVSQKTRTQPLHSAIIYLLLLAGCRLSEIVNLTWSEVKGGRLHDLRHSFASHAAARYETLPMIGKRLGHAKLQTTSGYAHLDDGPVLDAAGRIGSLIADMMGEDRPLSSNTMYDTKMPSHDRSAANPHLQEPLVREIREPLSDQRCGTCRCS